MIGLPPQQTEGKQYPYLFSQFQAIHARSFFPCPDCNNIFFFSKFSHFSSKAHLKSLLLLPKLLLLLVFLKDNILLEFSNKILFFLKYRIGCFDGFSFLNKISFLFKNSSFENIQREHPLLSNSIILPFNLSKKFPSLLIWFPLQLEEFKILK